MELLLNNPIALILVVVTILVHVIAFVLIHRLLRKGKKESQAD